MLILDGPRSLAGRGTRQHALLCADRGETWCFPTAAVLPAFAGCPLPGQSRLSRCQRRYGLTGTTRGALSHFSFVRVTLAPSYQNGSQLGLGPDYPNLILQRGETLSLIRRRYSVLCRPFRRVCRHTSGS